MEEGRTEVVMRMKCEVCDGDARFFTETYDPMTKLNRTVWLCEMHQADMFRRIEGALSDMRTMLKYERGNVRGIFPTGGTLTCYEDTALRYGVMTHEIPLKDLKEYNEKKE